MKKKYLLKLHFADGGRMEKFESKIISKLDEFSERACGARNPKKILSREYDENEDAVIVVMESSIQLDSPGRSLSGFSRSLLTTYNKEFEQHVIGKRLFRIESEDITDREKSNQYYMSDSCMVKIIADLLLEDATTREKHQRELIVTKIKDVLVESKYICEKFLGNLKVDNRMIHMNNEGNQPTKDHLSENVDYMKSIECNENEDEDNSKEANIFYENFFKITSEFKSIKNEEMRGETMCSLGTTFSNNNKNGDFVRLVDNEITGWKRSYTQDFNEEDIELFYLFRKGYHSLANFCIMPKELNYWRGKYDKSKDNLPNQGDYFDIFLNLIRNYYLNRKDNSDDVNRKLQDHIEWMDAFGKGEEGWKNFIDKNMFLAFVNKDFTVKDIFSTPEEFKSDKSPVVGTNHYYGKALAQFTDNPKQSAINYITNSLWIWNQRNQDLIRKR